MGRHTRRTATRRMNEGPASSSGEEEYQRTADIINKLSLRYQKPTAAQENIQPRQHLVTRSKKQTTESSSLQYDGDIENNIETSQSDSEHRVDFNKCQTEEQKCARPMLRSSARRVSPVTQDINSEPVGRQRVACKRALTTCKQPSSVDVTGLNTDENHCSKKALVNRPSRDIVRRATRACKAPKVVEPSKWKINTKKPTPLSTALPTNRMVISSQSQTSSTEAVSSSSDKDLQVSHRLRNRTQLSPFGDPTVTEQLPDKPEGLRRACLMRNTSTNSSKNTLSAPTTPYDDSAVFMSPSSISLSAETLSVGIVSTSTPCLVATSSDDSCFGFGSMRPTLPLSPVTKMAPLTEMGVVDVLEVPKSKSTKSSSLYEDSGFGSARKRQHENTSDNVAFSGKTHGGHGMFDKPLTKKTRTKKVKPTKEQLHTQYATWADQMNQDFDELESYELSIE